MSLLMGPILEKLLLANIKGSNVIFKKISSLVENPSFCAVSVYAEQSYLPQQGPKQKKFFAKP